MQKKFNKYEKFKILRKLTQENTDGVYDNNPVNIDYNVIDTPTEIAEPADIIKKSDKDDEDIPGIIKSNNPNIIAAYNRVLDKFKPSQLIFDNKDT